MVIGSHEFKCATVGDGDLSGDGEAQPHTFTAIAGGISAMEALEYLVMVSCWDAQTRIGDGEVNVIASTSQNETHVAVGPVIAQSVRSEVLQDLMH